MLGAEEKKSIHFEKGINVLNKFMGKALARLMKLTLHKWKRGIEAVYHELLVNSCLIVQRNYRKHQARVELNERMEQRKIQKAREDEIRKLFEVKINSAALQIQQRWRSRMACKAMEHRQLCNLKVQVIQRSFRCFIAKQDLKKLQATKQAKIEASIIIQKHWRANRGRMRFRVIGKIKKVEEMEKKEQERTEKIKRFFEDQGAAVQIQYAWRRRQLWLNLRYFMGAQRQLRAVRLQQAYRFFKAKLDVKRRRAEKNRIMALRLRSIILIQTTVRIFLAKCCVDDIKFNLEKQTLIRRLEKVHALRPRLLTLPIMGKVPLETKGDNKGKPKIDPDTGFEYEPKPITIDLKKLKRRRVDAVRILNPFTSRNERKHATGIQKVYRGHRARARVTFKRQMEKVALKSWQKQRQVACCTKLQAIFRGHKGRRYVTLLQHTTSCLLIQKCMRGWWGRRIANDKKRKRIAAICIQKQQRGYVKRVAYQEYTRTFKIQQKPARVIQRCGRRFIAKRAVGRVRKLARAEAEQQVIARANNTQCWKRSRLQLLLKSVYAPDGHKHDGVFQEFFKHWAGSDSSGNSMENMHFIKLFKDSNGIIGTKFYDYNLEKERKFEVTDLDLIFSRHKGSEVKHITYLQFVKILDQLGAELFPKTKDYLGHKGSNARCVCKTNLGRL